MKSITLSFFFAAHCYGATSFTHFSGDNALASGGVTGSNLSQVIEAQGGAINSAYSGTNQATRDNTNAFFNADLSAVPASTRFRVDISSVGGDVNVTTAISSGATGQSLYEIATGANVTQVTFTLTYLGQFDGANVYNEGFTGRFSGVGGTPGTNLRGAAIRNLSATESLNFALSSNEFGGASDSLVASDFYNGEFAPGLEFGDTFATSGVSGYGTGNVSGDFVEDGGFFFHNGSDLGDVSESLTYTVTATGGGAIDTGTLFRFTFDAMTLATSPIPEPSSALLLGMAGAALLGRRRRSN